MTKWTDHETDERARAWTPLLNWLSEYRGSTESEPSQTEKSATDAKSTKESSASDEDGEWVCIDGDTADHDAQGSPLPPVCRDPGFLKWINSDGRHLIEDDPRAIRWVAKALDGPDRNWAFVMRDLINLEWKKAAAIYQEVKGERPSEKKI
ncbi:hypothetical protein ACHAPT_005285 [Fusarium lateritium]